MARGLQYWDLEGSMRFWKTLADNSMVHAQGNKFVFSIYAATVGGTTGAPTCVHDIKKSVVCKKKT